MEDQIRSEHHNFYEKLLVGILKLMTTKNDIFELFMKIRFPDVEKDSIYWIEWKGRFDFNREYNSMDFFSLKVYIEILKKIIFENNILSG